MKTVKVIVEMQVPEELDDGDVVAFVDDTMQNADFFFIEELAGQELDPAFVYPVNAVQL